MLPPNLTSKGAPFYNALVAATITVGFKETSLGREPQRNPAARTKPCKRREASSAAECGEPSAASRVCDERPVSRGALDPAPSSQKGKVRLDNADDVIHDTAESSTKEHGSASVDSYAHGGVESGNSK